MAQAVIEFEVPTDLKSPDGLTRTLIECTQNPDHGELYDYTMEIQAEGQLHTVKSTCTLDILQNLHRWHYAMTGNYDALVDRPLVLDILHDPMEFKFSIWTDGGEYSFRVPFYDVDYDELEQYANELYHLDIWGRSEYQSGAIGTTRHAISLREFQSYWKGHENASAWDRTLSNVARTVEEYQERLSHFARTGEKKLTW